jgi:hypothetical protein
MILDKIAQLRMEPETGRDGCHAEDRKAPTSNPFVTPKVGSILKLLTNDIQGGKIQSGKEELNGFKRVIWEIAVQFSFFL